MTNLRQLLPPLNALRTFEAAARHGSFKMAAEELCVSQAAISRQIRELEIYLGDELFTRVGRTVELTNAGSIFFDAVQLSFANISQAAERIRRKSTSKRVLTLCCSPAFSALWLARRLPSFFSANPDVDLNLITTQNFLSMEPGVSPDIFVTKIAKVREGYRNYPLVHDVIYPVCTPKYLEEHPEISSLEGLRDSVLLNLSPYGRSQVAEHVDWNLWLAYHDIDLGTRPPNAPHFFNANDYNLLIQMVLSHQGVSLGWHYLVNHLINEGLLVRPVEQELVHTNSVHYLAFDEEKDFDDACCRLRDWLINQF
ncbi:TPA: LysR family transcriptional regulator [Pseudomonas aeruginosa]|uniref:LysR family transcriptional regulator n=1 Tax=Pseudomonas aeruginosa TaxID=287 RepID=UPI0020767755|nr:LysR family transcriptional regulator [Pseudomonas aeruginosa]MCM8589364.1 LysR family transcriptional regulator [Pseudomonas aeruginosa]MCM8673275.1 LysR family transcriptional regulator [Pseudomonas aeruginosa]MCP2653222.1 LysR family transcriptional regulator [Pseudomonas aeruginosa]WBH34811.1 Glycine cleavage system transcriptional activator [Pseudomonas aeruginosa]HBO3281645.1 LysR family transcriptional regulator [Pseudomonas aeruginosa]